MRILFSIWLLSLSLWSQQTTVSGNVTVSGTSLFGGNNGPALPITALFNWNTSRAATPTSNVTICVGTPVNAAILPGGGCNTSYAATAVGLTTALANAVCGQVINITPGTFGAGLTSPYVGAFNWPKLNCPNTNWLWIARDLSDPVAPPEGTRVDPSYAGIPQNAMPYESYPLANATPNSGARHMPQFNCNLTSGNSCFGWDSSVNSPAGNHLRLVGLDITRDESFDSSLALADFDYQPMPDCALTGTGNNALPTTADLCQADQPNFIILDQVLLHGSAQRQTVIGLKLAGATWVACVDCYAYDFGVTFAGGNGDGHFFGGGTGHGYTGVGKWIFKNTYSESSTMSNEFCGAFDEPLSPVTHADGIPTDVVWTQNEFWKKPLWDPQIGQAHNAAVVVEGQSYGPTPPQEIDVTPSTVSIQQGNQFQLQTLLLWDTSSGINRILQHLGGVGTAAFAATVDGIQLGDSAHGIMTTVSANVGTGAWVSQNQIKWTYTACLGNNNPVGSGCTAATTTGAHVVVFAALANSNVLATQGTTLTLTASSTVTVTSGAPTPQIAVSPNSSTLSIQPSYSDIYFNVRKFCYTMFGFPNYSPTSISWAVDGVVGGNATVGTVTTLSGSSFSGTSPSSAAYCSGTQTGNHTIAATGNDATTGSSVISVSTGATIYAYDLKSFSSKNCWELKCGERILLEKSLAVTSWGGAGNGGGQPGNWFLTQVGNQASQTLDGSGNNVGYGPQHINDITIRYFHAVHMGSGMVIAALNSALGVRRVSVSFSECEDCDFTSWMNGFQKRSQVAQLSGSPSTTVLSWTSPSNPLFANISVTHITFSGPVTSLLSLTNNNAQSQLGPFIFQNNIVSSTGAQTFQNNFGDVDDCNAASGTGSNNSEALAFQGTGFTPASPCFSQYTFSPNVLMDSTACPQPGCGGTSVFSSSNIFQPAATAVGFVNYNSGNGGDYRLCTGFHTPSVLCGAASPYAAGQAHPASDGLDQGADIINQAVYDLAVRTGTRTP